MDAIAQHKVFHAGTYNTNPVVMAAGLGTRLRPLTYGTPKPMVPVANRPVMEHILRLLPRHGFEQVIAKAPFELARRQRRGLYPV